MCVDTLITGEQLLQMGEDFELVRGVLVPMTPPGAEHGEIQTCTATVLKIYARQVGGRVMTESGIYTEENPDSVRGPDVLYYAPGRLEGRQRGYLRVPPDLVVEIISPEDRSAEIEAKVAEYLARGIKRVWVLDPDTRNIYIHGQGVRKLPCDERLTDPEVLPGFSCLVEELFS